MQGGQRIVRRLNSMGRCAMNRYFQRRRTVAGLLAVVAVTAAIAGASLASAVPALRGLSGHSATADPAINDAHFNKILTQILPDGTPKQRAQLKLIANSVHTDLNAFHAQFRTAHQRAYVLVLQPWIAPPGWRHCVSSRCSRRTVPRGGSSKGWPTPPRC